MQMLNSIAMKNALFLIVILSSCESQPNSKSLQHAGEPEAVEHLNPTSSASTAPGANVILESTFENRNAFKNWHLEICRDDAVKISSDVSRKGVGSARFEFSKSDVTKYDGFLRAEIRQESGKDDEGWYGFSNFLPNDFVSDPLAEIIAQWHEMPDFDRGESWRSPPIALSIREDRYYVTVMWAAAPVNTNETKDGEESFDLGPVDRNKWNDWVFHIKFSYKDDGILEVWKNNTQLVSYYGPNSFNDSVYPYFKIGIYKWGWNGWAKHSRANRRVIYYDEVRVGNRNSNIREVSPGD